jgi:YidC/Oxa1 family membrane protein insertase
LNFPVGLVIYWLTNNLLTILQQWWVMRRAS